MVDSIEDRIRKEHLLKGGAVEPRIKISLVTKSVERQLVSTGMCEKHIDQNLYFTDSFANVLALAMGYWETGKMLNGRPVCATIEIACRKAVQHYLRVGTRPKDLEPLIAYVAGVVKEMDRK